LDTGYTAALEIGFSVCNILNTAYSM